MSKEFETDSVHGLISMLFGEVIGEIENTSIKERGIKLLTEIDNRVTKTDDDLAEAIEGIENIRGSL